MLFDRFATETFASALGVVNRDGQLSRPAQNAMELVVQLQNIELNSSLRQLSNFVWDVYLR